MPSLRRAKPSLSGSSSPLFADGQTDARSRKRPDWRLPGLSWESGGCNGCSANHISGLISKVIRDPAPFYTSLVSLTPPERFVRSLLYNVPKLNPAPLQCRGQSSAQQAPLNRLICARPCFRYCCYLEQGVVQKISWRRREVV